jgi:hypothetical protein
MHQKNLGVISTPQQFKKTGMSGDKLVQVLRVILRDFKNARWPMAGVLSTFGQNAVTFVDHQQRMTEI